MSFDEPDQTGGGVRINPKDIVGHLLLLWVIDYVAHSPTQFSKPDKPSDVIIVDAVDLDQVDADTGIPGLVARKCWWRQAQLIQALRPKIGSQSPMLVRMTKGGATMGRSAPFQLASMTADQQCVARGTNWINANPGFTPSVKPDFSAPSEPRVEEPMPDGHWANPNTPLPPPRPVTQPELSVLERMARMSQQPPQMQETSQYPY